MSSLSPATPLPTPRQLLTSLLSAIGDIPVLQEDEPLPPQQQQQGYAALEKRAAPLNPLRLIHPSHRALFTTLHVLFPSLLLPALDLLDRGLVTRLILHPKAAVALAGQPERPKGVDVPPPGDQEGAQAGQAPQDTPRAQRRYLYLVRSAQATTTRRPYAAGGFSNAEALAGGQAYVVHTEAWNCTCAAFAFAAFPAGPSPNTSFHDGKSSFKDEGEGKQVDLGLPHDGLEREPGWQFGGMSSDGVVGEGSDGVPSCKHLLACVLAERWPGGLGRYVVERQVTKEEMAGIIADV